MKINKLICSFVSIPALATSFIPLTSCKDKETGAESFSKDSWSTVVNLCNKGLDALQDHYGIDSFIGLKRQITINGLVHNVKVIGQNEDFQYKIEKHKIVPDYSKPVALTFQFDNVISTIEDDEIVPVTIEFSTSIELEEGYEFAYSGWYQSKIWNYLNSLIPSNADNEPFIYQLTHELGPDAIKQVCKYSFNNSTKVGYPSTTIIDSFPDKVFLPSLGDIYTGEDNFPEIPEEWGQPNKYLEETNVDKDGVAHAYSYYRNILSDKLSYADSVKDMVLSDCSGRSQYYWLRSGILADFDPTLQTYQWSVTSRGDCCGEGLTPINSELSVAPCFCI